MRVSDRCFCWTGCLIETVSARLTDNVGGWPFVMEVVYFLDKV